MKYADIKLAAKTAGARLWQIAEALGMQDNSFSRKLRHELPEAEKSRIRAIIADLSAGEQ